MGFLEGVKVIDFTHAYAGPFCTLNLGDYGAEVIKIERPDGGDQARGWGPFIDGYSGYYASFNRGKKSLTVNIREEKGQKILKELIKDADVVCSNFKAGTLEKYGLGYEEISKINPKVIYATVSGFGTKGELSKFAAYDNVIQAMSGVMDVNGFADGVPTKIGPAVGDSYSGLLALLGLMIAYYDTLKTGKGQQVDVTMLGALFGFLEYPVLEYGNNNKILTRMGNSSLYTAPEDVYKTKDDYIAISVKGESQWIEFCNKLGIENNERIDTNEKRLKEKDYLKTIIEDKFKNITSKDGEILFQETKIAVAAVMSIKDSLTDPHLLERKMVIDVKDPVLGDIKLVGNPIHLSENEPITNIPSPTLGEHTNSILANIGYSEEELQELKALGVI